MSDLISKKELYRKLGEAYNKGFLSWGANEVIKDIIGECDSVENKGEWNPIKTNEEGMIIDSLPEEGEEVLVTVYGQVEIDSFGCDVEYDESFEECRFEWFCENNDIEDVKAWMPLPEPYKAEKGGE